MYDDPSCRSEGLDEAFASDSGATSGGVYATTNTIDDHHHVSQSMHHDSQFSSSQEEQVFSIMKVSPTRVGQQLNSSPTANLPFLSLEPPLSEEDYNFALEASEGITDLFGDELSF